MRISMRICMLFFICLLVASVAMGQIVTSSVKGTVVDSSGAVVNGATCTLTNVATGQTATAPTMGDGGFTFANVQSGDYKLSITAAGFKFTTSR